MLVYVDYLWFENKNDCVLKYFHYYATHDLKIFMIRCFPMCDLFIDIYIDEDCAVDFIYTTESNFPLRWQTL